MKKYWIALNHVQSIYGQKLKKLIEIFQTPQSLWEASVKDLRNIPFLNSKNIDEIIYVREKFDFQRFNEQISSLKINVLTFEEDDYPDQLKNIYDPPPVLYIRGQLPQNKLAIAIVGARKASPYGLLAAEKIATELGMADATVISGMARGIDSLAHKGVLKGGGTTIAVLGCGVNVIYPKENRKLMEEICERGAVISEFPLGCTPLPWRFPVRNRIISGLAQGVLVVEAALSSGSLITSDYALEQGRDVFAVPGNINNPLSQGTNNLIKQGAKLVENAHDILEEYGLGLNFMKNSNNIQQMTISFSDEEAQVYKIIDSERIHIDELVYKLKLPLNQILSSLINLELNGHIKQLPGQFYVRAI